MIKYMLIFIGLVLCWPKSLPMKKVTDIFEEIKRNNTYPLLKSRNFDVNSYDDDGCTVLHHYAAYGNKFYMFKALAERNADFNDRNIAGETPLFVAIKNGNFPGALLLIRFGANPEIPNFDGRNCLHLFFANEYLVSFLNRAYEESIRPEMIGSRKFVKRVFFLIKQTAQEPICSLKDLAAKELLKREERVTTILGSSIPSDIKDFIVLIACKDNCAFATNLLESRKSLACFSWISSQLTDHHTQVQTNPINSRDRSGQTPLHYAAKNHARLPVIKQCMQQGASAILKDRNERYPFELLEEKFCRSCALHEDISDLTAELTRPKALMEYLDSEIKLMRAQEQKK